MYSNLHSLRRPRRRCVRSCKSSVNFNPRGLRKLWPNRFRIAELAGRISIHTAFAGCDRKSLFPIKPSAYFNPHSLRRLWRTGLSITLGDLYFNPHSLRRLWLILSSWMGESMKFQSTQPSQAVTIISKLCDKSIDISIHTAFAGCDGDRHRKGYCRHISIHTAFAGCDAFHVILLSYDSIFQSTQPSQAVTANLTNFSSQISILLSHILHIPSNKSTPLHTFSSFSSSFSS